MKLDGGCASDIGIARKVNQDAILFQYMEKNGQYFAVGAVCDGVGGLEYGEKASELVIQEIRKWFTSIAAWIDIAQVESEVLYAHLLDEVEDWNIKVRELAERENIHTGTTLSLILIIRDRYYIVQVGDSRIYRYRQFLELLTTDAIIARLKKGRMKEYLVNYMGKEEKLWFTTAEGIFQDRDMFLFCSDGGYHFLIETDVKNIYMNYTQKMDLTEVSKHLIKKMIARGEHDNISIGIIMAEKAISGRWKRLIRK